MEDHDLSVDEGPTLIEGKYFRCDLCPFLEAEERENNGVKYTIFFCEWSVTNKMARRGRFIGEEDFTPEWCPILETIED